MRVVDYRSFVAAMGLAAIALPALAHASQDEIVVTAGREARQLSQIGQSVSVIGEEEILTRQSVSVLDALRTVPGVSFTRSGGPGTAASVFLRGGNRPRRWR